MTDGFLDKRVTKFIEYARKRRGKDIVMRLNEGALERVKVIPTGALNLDVALGIGGIPQGRVVEIYGNEGSGKTTLALHIGAEAMKKGLPVLYIDAENALDPSYAATIGLNTESGNFILSQPDDAESALGLIEDFATIVGEGLVVVDSVAALVPRQELQGDIGDSNVAVLARLMSQSLRRLARTIKDRDTALVFLNQIREKVGVLYGNPEVTPGGRALKFYASVRLEVRRKEVVRAGGEIVGHDMKVRVTKNKLYPPYKEAIVRIIYGKGIDVVHSIMEAALAAGVIERRGSFYSIDGQRLAQGKEELRKVLMSSPELVERIRNMVLSKVRGSVAGAQEETQS